jgi:sec-independent protein translocase protein TatA
MFDLTALMAIWTPGPLDLIIVLVVALLIFGPRLPKVARSVGQSLTEFKKGVKDGEDQARDFINQADRESDEAAESSSQEDQATTEETEDQEKDQA